ncbi:MAG: cysteine desulfurase [Candidatus Infernicultor aquiphilus]|uniref:cysteine desulfurase n=3 Tax=Candidatus Infernicultor aquiphilus TaxID=1805029 RepID=A0A1J5GJ69_9BACT|nr:MAG: cysteine desulfurase [Candidatus Atribacteria bacterium CG2_30_33_13]PIU24649.1 MAG: cysteine desulfurase [Candidatus Atribacteria bacterium CG08_land_8_20_14_0_20_33_29]PIW11249.1 MAG: cysteine desulfurase [Candidatus Atribacteria bacterium CG17_big_fil_post_rev_8_21_14_2_50_34_11]PIY31517.1 MAG: cysteine desulfurase [Candidatus Atribacteria bacterium CG_4_10_14_3_um_filter_34_13]PJB57238.1 MAG: cysteine desulfurase [Candidatus Atribacteria bacterium CG_4_9_14_3_um_filter_33_16]
MIYLDNAATSYPKPKEVGQAMMYFLEKIGATPGRSSHRLSIESARILYQARESLAELFNVDDPLRIIFTLNVTEALNLALKGLLRPGDQVITSSMEHNSVMRPLCELEKRGVEVMVVPCSSQGVLDPVDLERAIKKNTKLIVLNHGSNVIGSLLPITVVGEIAKRHHILFLVDTAQTAGCYPLDIKKDNIDLLAFTGHKALYGPPGTGGLVIGERVDTKKLIPLKVGGTGSHSEFEEQPDFLPDIYESGTPNIVGLNGLKEGVRFVLAEGVDKIHQHEKNLIIRLIEGLKEIPEVTLYGGDYRKEQVAVVSFNLKDKWPSEVGMRLDEEYDIMCRVGLHCSPATHKTIGTFPRGTVRFSMSWFNTLEEVDQAIIAIRDIAKGA